jgi:flagellar biosynthesis anti-sigma factor FlgM
MRIDLFNSTASEIASDKDPKQISGQTSAGSGSGAVSAEDRTTLVSDSTSVDSLVNAALNSPAVRQDKVDNLRVAVNGGHYPLVPSDIATSILDEQA